MNSFSKILDRIKAIEEEIRVTPYHKGTEHHIGILRAKLAKLREELYSTRRSRGGSEKGLRKHGDATVALIGPPSVGKSTLLNCLSGANSKVASYNFTTVDPIPGMMDLNGAKIQLIDLPGLIDQAYLGRGDGKRILATARSSDLLLLVSDYYKLKDLFSLISELKKAGFRLNLSPPNIVVKKLQRGGLKIIDPFSSLSSQTVERICQEFGIKNAEIVFKERVNVSSLIDYLLGNRIYIPAIFVVNKSDLLSSQQIKEVKKRVFSAGFDPLVISAQDNTGIDFLKEKIWEKLGLIRVYLKRKVNSEPEKEPVVLKKGDKVGQLIEKIHSDWVKSALGAWVWGRSVKFGGQKVSLEHVLEDGDVVFVERR